MSEEPQSTIIRLAALVLIFMAVGCAHHQMSKPTVIQTANRAFVSAGYKTGDYKNPAVSLHSTPTNSAWCVFYDPVLTKGSSVRIIVDDKTGSVKFVPIDSKLVPSGMPFNVAPEMIP